MRKGRASDGRPRRSDGLPPYVTANNPQGVQTVSWRSSVLQGERKLLKREGEGMGSGGRRVQPLKLGIVTARRHVVGKDLLAASVWRPPVSIFSSPRLSTLLLLAVGSWRELTSRPLTNSLLFLLFNTSKRIETRIKRKRHKQH